MVAFEVVVCKYDDMVFPPFLFREISSYNYVTGMLESSWLVVKVLVHNKSLKLNEL